MEEFSFDNIESVLEPTGIEARRQQLHEFLAEEGFRPVFSVEDPTRIIFKCEGLSLFVDLYENDPTFYQMICPHFWAFDDDSERKRALAAASEVNGMLKLVKMVPLNNGMIATVELLCVDFDQFRQVFERARKYLLASLPKFRDEMNRLAAN